MQRRRVVKVPNPLQWRYVGSICVDGGGCYYIYVNTQTGAHMNVYSTSGPPALYAQ
jgi:hypothetical protein